MLGTSSFPTFPWKTSDSCCGGKYLYISHGHHDGRQLPTSLDSGSGWYFMGSMSGRLDGWTGGLWM